MRNHETTGLAVHGGEMFCVASGCRTGGGHFSVSAVTATFDLQNQDCTCLRFHIENVPTDTVYVRPLLLAEELVYQRVVSLRVDSVVPLQCIVTSLLTSFKEIYFGLTGVLGIRNRLFAAMPKRERSLIAPYRSSSTTPGRTLRPSG